MLLIPFCFKNFFISFSCLIALARTSIILLNKSDENEYPYLISDHKGKAFSFSLNMILAVGLSHMAFVIVRYISSMAFPHGSVDKVSASKKEIQIQSLHQEDPLEKEMATHSSILA